VLALSLEQLGHLWLRCSARMTHNLYLVKTPAVHADGTSCIEDFFPGSLLKTKLEGKTFNPHKEQRRKPGKIDRVCIGAPDLLGKD
jgi:hypothetical protein